MTREPAPCQGLRPREVKPELWTGLTELGTLRTTVAQVYGLSPAPLYSPEDRVDRSLNPRTYTVTLALAAGAQLCPSPPHFT